MDVVNIGDTVVSVHAVATVGSVAMANKVVSYHRKTVATVDTLGTVNTIRGFGGYIR